MLNPMRDKNENTHWGGEGMTYATTASPEGRWVLFDLVRFELGRTRDNQKYSIFEYMLVCIHMNVT